MYLGYPVERKAILCHKFLWFVAQIDKARNDVEGRTVGKYTEAESVTLSSQGRVWGWCGQVFYGTCVGLGCVSAGDGENLIRFTLINE